MFERPKTVHASDGEAIETGGNKTKENEMGGTDITHERGEACLNI
jgi:hypothetical protein